MKHYESTPPRFRKRTLDQNRCTTHPKGQHKQQERQGSTPFHQIPLHPPQGCQRKGQLSVALIIGVLLIAFLGGLLYQATILIKERSKQQLEAQTMIQSKITPIQDYVQACLELASKDGLLTLGQQGGYLFRGTKGSNTEGQGGLTQDFSPSEIGRRYMTDPDIPGHIIPYVIFKRETSTLLNWLFSDTPLSPYQTFPMWRLENDAGGSPDQTPYDGHYHFDGIYGANLLPRLYGPQPLPDFLDPQHLNQPIPSIQDQLETFILNHTLSCIDFSTFSHSNLDFTPLKGNATVMFLNGTTVHFHYPITMTDRVTGGQGTLNEWSTTLPVRFSYFHAVLDFAASRESDTMLFFMSNLSTPDHSITPIMRKNIGARSDYIVTYTDRNSTIDGKPYQFRFAIHNRPPALYYLNRTVKGTVFDPYTRPGPAMDLSLSDITGFTICTSKTPDGTPIPATITTTNRGQGAIIEFANARVSSASSQCPQTNLRIPLFALDPDEDVPRFSISVLGQEGLSYTVDPAYADLLEHRNEKLSLTVIASDGALFDSQELLLPTHYEPPVIH